jgi:hypothetical protein
LVVLLVPVGEKVLADSFDLRGRRSPVSGGRGRVVVHHGDLAVDEFGNHRGKVAGRKLRTEYGKEWKVVRVR